MHRPHSNVLRVFKGQRKNKQAGVQGGGEHAEEEGWRAQQRPELGFGFDSAALWRMDYNEYRKNERAAGRPVRRLPQYPGENLWGLGTSAMVW